MRARLAVLVLLPALAACRGDDRSAVSILEGTTWPAADVVSLTVDSCNASPTAALVRSTAQEVRVRVEASPSDDDCADGVLVCLDGPLGDRTLVDDSSDDVVRVEISDADAFPGCPVA